jgi:hypothetical protein
MESEIELGHYPAIVGERYDGLRDLPRQFATSCDRSRKTFRLDSTRTRISLSNRIVRSLEEYRASNWVTVP